MLGADGTVISRRDCRHRYHGAQAGRGRISPALNQALRQEIAERERVERQARLLAAVLEASPDFVGIADPSGHVLHLNRAFKEALHRSPETELADDP